MEEVGKMLFEELGRSMATVFQTTIAAQKVLTKRMKRFGRIEGNSMEHFPSCLLIPTLLVI